MLRYVSSVLTVAVAAAVFPGPAQAAKPDPSVTLVFATYNVCKTSCGSGRFAWERRKDAAVRNILASRADVVALQEVDNSYPWLAEQLAKHGYRRVETSIIDCRNACVDDSQLFYRTATVAPADLRVPSDPIPAVCAPYLGDQEPPFAEPTWPIPGPAPQPPSISPWDPDYVRQYDEYRKRLSEYNQANDAAEEAYYDAEDVYRAQVRAWEKVGRDNNCDDYSAWQPFTSVGFGSPDNASLVPQPLTRAADNRNFAWAVLRDRRSGSVFLATSMHLPNEKSGPAEKLRKRLAAGIPGYLAKQRQDLGLQGAPSIVMGDFNSYRQRQPRGAQWVLGKQGYRDAFTAKRTVNADVPTVNVTTKYRDPFPAKPFHLDQPARLDYVFVEGGTPVRYELQLHLRNGKFDNRYRASDHNLVTAQLRLKNVPLPDRWK